MAAASDAMPEGESPADVPATVEAEAPAHRLMISKMVLHNFKSYAGVRTIGPLHRNLSAVVGPNGSGKSNVIDGMLFVFGKRAKKLRLNKVSELIHCSTEHPDCEFAKVSVHFQDIIDGPSEADEDYEVVAGSEIVVSRVAYKSNKSDYFLDGKRATFTEVGALLRKRGIDLDNNRFLILQGEVEQISLMKPKALTPHEDGLLEYLEDIIGSNQYVDDIEAAGKRVEELSDRRMERLNRVKVVEKEKDNLEDARVEAEAYLAKERTLLKRRNELFQLELAEATEAAAATRTKLEELEDKNVADVEAELGTAQQEHETAVEQLKKTKKEFAAFERKDIKYKEDMKHTKASAKKLESTAKKEGAKEQKAQAKAQSARDAVAGLEENVAKAELAKQAREAALEKLYAGLQGETEALRVEMESAQVKLAPLSAEASEAKSRLDVSRTEVELLEKRATGARAQLKAARAELANTERAIGERPAQIKRARAEHTEAEARLDEVRSELASSAEREGALAESARGGRARLEQGRAQLAAASTRSVMLQSLVEAQRAGGELAAAGLAGRLGDLGSIDPKYDVAVSTASGALDFLVTDTTAGAEACVGFLRKRELGRATFVILEKQAHLTEEAMKWKGGRTPEGVPRLFDLVRPAHARFRPAFFYALRNTLVAKDMEQAVRIAYKNNRAVHRVVTLKGELIDSTGTMSGGGNRAKKGSMTLAGSAAAAASAASSAAGGDACISVADVAALEAEADAAASELKVLRERRRVLKKEERALEKRLGELEIKVKKLEMELGSLAEQRPQLEANIAALEPQCELSGDDASRLEELKRTMRTNEAAHAAAAKAAAALEEQVEALQKRILSAGGEAARKEKSRVEAAADALAEATRAVSKPVDLCAYLAERLDV